MSLPTAAQVLDLWDGFGDSTLPERALAMLGTVDPDAEPGSLTLSERDRRLVELRREIVGSAMEMVVTCPDCHEEMSFTVDAGDLVLGIADGASAGEERTASLNGWNFLFRIPTGDDLRDAVATGDHDLARQLLIGRCLRELDDGATEFDPATPPPDAERAFVEVLEQAAPGAELRFQVSCGGCGHEWDADFDITSYLWNEIAQLARRILGDVHALALGYGWNESWILAMSARRRATYIEMLP